VRESYHFLAMQEVPSKPPRVGIYVRISDDRDGLQTATARQLADCRSFCSRQGWDMLDVFEDVDISAYSARARRPEFERMLEMLRAGAMDGVVVWKLDRLTRQQRDLSRVVDACNAHAAFVASVTEPIDTRETYGQFVAELLVAQARMESANTSTRSRRKAQEQRESGLPPVHGRRCFGYEKGYRAVVPAEADLVREAIRRIFAGESFRGICFDWERHGVTTVTGGPWRVSALERYLKSPTISAQRQGDGVLISGTWPAIITPEESLQLRTFLSLRSKPRAAPRRYLLTGIIRCGVCGERMYSGTRHDEARRYICYRRPGYRNCGGVSTLAQPVEDLVLEMLLVALDDGALAVAMSSRAQVPADDIIGSIQRDDIALRALSDDFYVQAIIGRDEFLSARASLSNRLELNRSRLARQTGPELAARFVGASRVLREAWASASLDWRRASVDGLLDRILIMPTTQKGRRPFDVDRVKPIWRC
jgi:site-specific DNA recombinase